MLLQARGITKSYGNSGSTSAVVLTDINFDCDHGEFVAIMGPSGAGKSTLMHILASLDKADKGTVTLMAGGVPIRYDEQSPAKLSVIRNTSLGIVYQFHHLLPEFTAHENVMLPLLIAGASRGKAERDATRMIERVGLGQRAHHYPSQLSGGEQQRIAMARALVNNPTVIFADEPTGNLDTSTANIISDLLSDLQREYGLACVVATHSEVLAQNAHRIVRLKDGRIQQ